MIRRFIAFLFGLEVPKRFNFNDARSDELLDHLTDEAERANCPHCRFYE